MGTPFDCKTLLPHYTSCSKSIDCKQADLASLGLPGSEPLVSDQIKMRSWQNPATKNPDPKYPSLNCPLKQSAKRRAQSEKLSKSPISTLCALRYAISLGIKDQVFDVELSRQLSGGWDAKCLTFFNILDIALNQLLRIEL